MIFYSKTKLCKSSYILQYLNNKYTKLKNDFFTICLGKIFFIKVVFQNSQNVGTHTKIYYQKNISKS